MHNYLLNGLSLKWQLIHGWGAGNFIKLIREKLIIELHSRSTVCDSAAEYVLVFNTKVKKKFGDTEDNSREYIRLDVGLDDKM